MDAQRIIAETIYLKEVTQPIQTPRTSVTTGVADGDSRQADDESHGQSSQRYASTAKNIGNNDTTRENKSSPPPEPTALPHRNATAFEVKTYNTGEQIKTKLAIEFLLKKEKNFNDVTLFFKRLMAANKEIQLLKWESSTKIPIAKAIDTVYDEDTISKMKSERKRIEGFTRISSPIKFALMKNHSQCFHWLQTNEV